MYTVHNKNILSFLVLQVVFGAQVVTSDGCFQDHSLYHLELYTPPQISYDLLQSFVLLAATPSTSTCDKMYTCNDKQGTDVHYT